MLKKLFQSIDTATFKGVDNLKSTPQFSQLSNSIEGLPEEGQKVVNQGLTYLISFLPVIVLLIVFFINSSIRSSIAEKEQLIEDIGLFNELRVKSTKVGNKLVGRTPLNGENDLKNKLRDIAASYGLQASALTVGDFANKQFGDLIQTEASVGFKELSTPKLFGLLDSFLVQEKARLIGIKVSKRNETINGEFSFTHYGRQPSTPQ